MHCLRGLHLHHQMAVAEAGILGPQPIQPLRRAHPQDFEETEQRLEELVPLAHLIVDECSDRGRAIRVDRAEEPLLDFSTITLVPKNFVQRARATEHRFGDDLNWEGAGRMVPSGRAWRSCTRCR